MIFTEVYHKRTLEKIKASMELLAKNCGSYHLEFDEMKSTAVPLLGKRGIILAGLGPTRYLLREVHDIPAFSLPDNMEDFSPSTVQSGIIKAKICYLLPKARGRRVTWNLYDT